jgi:hypothetical protein
VPKQKAINFAALIIVCTGALLYGAALAQRILFHSPGL